jgi:hypothetical protein
VRGKCGGVVGDCESDRHGAFDRRFGQIAGTDTHRGEEHQVN